MTHHPDSYPTMSRLSLRRRGSLVATALALAVALVVAPIVGIAPTSAARADVTVGDWAALQSAFSAGGTQTVTLDGDVDAPAGESLALVSGDAVVLDLNGHTLAIGSDATRPADYHAAINVPEGATLTIRDTGGGGKLIAFGGNYSAGIGVGARSGAGTIQIDGGSVTARGGLSGAGIGGGLQNLAIGTIIITDGTVNAIGGTGGSGIGGGSRGPGIKTTISGGLVKAEGNGSGAGIGGGWTGDGGDVTLSGGRIVAEGGSYAAGIGGGYAGSSGGAQTRPGTLTVIGTAASGSALNGASGPRQSSGNPGGPAPAFTRISASNGYFATTGLDHSGGRFTIDFEWFASFDAAGGAPTPATQKASVGATITEPSDPSRAHYDFSGWHAGSADGAAWDFTSNTSNHDLTLVARWTPVVYGLNYDFDGGIGDGANPSTYTVDSEAIVLATPARTGYAFLGWTGTGLSDMVGSVTIPTGSGGDRSYIAHWSLVSYTLGYDLDGGSDGGANSASYNVWSDAITLTTPIRTGYVFLGWTGTDLSGTVGSVTIPSGSIGNRSYTAHWSLVDYTLGYDFDGGTDDGANPTTYSVESDAITLTTPLRTGYVFLGWTGTGLTGTVETVTIPSGSIGDRSYTAHWESDTPTNAILPTISGTTGLGDTLTAAAGGWDLVGLSFAYQWYRDGQLLGGANSSSYTLVTEDLGTGISVRVTASRAGDDRYQPATAASAGTSIPLGTIDPAPTPTITGTVSGDAEVGATLTVIPGSWGPDAIDLSYQWHLDGIPLVGAVESTLTPKATQLGATITVRVTGSLANYVSTTRASTGVAVVPGEFTPGEVFVITGTPGVGHLLAVSDEPWVPSDATLSYVWLRDGVPIGGATDASYLLDVADEEVHISVTVTVTKPGYHDFEVTTDQVTIDAEPAITPDAPDQSGLTDATRGDVTANRTGNTVAITVADAGSDPRWVYVYGFSTPTGLGWHRTIDGTVTVNVAALGAGTHQLAVLDIPGSLVGWASIEIPALAFSGAPDPTPLIGGAALLMLLGGLAIWLRRRNSSRGTREAKPVA